MHSGISFITFVCTFTFNCIWYFFLWMECEIHNTSSGIRTRNYEKHTDVPPQCNSFRILLVHNISIFLCKAQWKPRLNSNKTPVFQTHFYRNELWTKYIPDNETQRKHPNLIDNRMSHCDLFHNLMSSIHRIYLQRTALLLRVSHYNINTGKTCVSTLMEYRCSCAHTHTVTE